MRRFYCIGCLACLIAASLFADNVVRQADSDLNGLIDMQPSEEALQSVLGIEVKQVEKNAEHFDLAKTFDRVQSENFTVLLNRQVVEESLQRAYMERSRLFPQFNLELKQIRNQIDNVGRGLGPLGDIEFPPANRFDGIIAGTMSIFDLRKIADYKLARKGYKISDASYENILQDVLAIAGNAYLDYLRDLTRLEVIRSNIYRDRVLLELAQAQFEGGVAMRLDVTRAEVRVAEDIKQRLQQETRVLTSSLNFKRLLNIDLDASVNLSDDRAYMKPKDYDVPLAEVLAQRADYRAASMEVEKAKLERKAAGWEHLPKVDIFGNYGYASEDAFNSKKDNVWLVGVQLDVPVFEGFRIRSNKLRTDAVIREKQYALKDLELVINEEYKVVAQDMQSRYDQIIITEKKVKLAQEELELAQDRFEKGVADNRDLVDAQNSLAVSQDEYIDAVYQYNLSRIKFARVLGDVRLVLKANEHAEALLSKITS